MYLLRHLLSVLILPATVVLVIPGWIARRYAIQPAWPETPIEIALASMGILLLIPGLWLFGASVRHFFVSGRGTLAPWDPPRHLVVRGPYRYVRNPMIGGVIFILFGQALLLRSVPHGIWALAFVAINATYIPLSEERALAHRFGEDYEQYRRNVRRFIPRVSPWDGDRS